MSRQVYYDWKGNEVDPEDVVCEEKRGMKIEFYIPDGQMIPTRLRLRVDDKYDVFYREDPNEFAYHFTFQSDAREHYREILDEIVDRMESQSYDHGACWRETGREVTYHPDKFWESLTVKVSFRVRDAG